MNSSKSKVWSFDSAFALLIVTLLVIGLTMIYNASAALTLDLKVPSYFFMLKQAIAVSIGIALLIFSLLFDYRRLTSPTIYFTLLALSWLLLIAVLFSPAINNAHRWFRVLGVSFQPSEFAKIALIVALAAVASRWRKMLQSWGFIFLTLAVIAAPIICLIALEPDFGTAAVLTLASLSVLFTAGIGMRKILVLFILVAIGLTLFVAVSPYRWERVKTYLSSNPDLQKEGFQAEQSKIALGSGGLIGLGPMHSKQKFFYLPAAHTDFIFSVIGEEWGLAGSMMIIFLYLALFARSLRIAFTARDFFGFLLTVGLGTMITGQALINISVATTLLPTKGIPLPLISYGGSSVIATLVALGLILNVSQFCKKDN